MSLDGSEAEKGQEVEKGEAEQGGQEARVAPVHYGVMDCEWLSPLLFDRLQDFKQCDSPPFIHCKQYHLGINESRMVIDEIVRAIKYSNLWHDFVQAPDTLDRDVIMSRNLAEFVYNLIKLTAPVFPRSLSPTSRLKFVDRLLDGRRGCTQDTVSKLSMARS